MKFFLDSFKDKTDAHVKKLKVQIQCTCTYIIGSKIRQVQTIWHRLKIAQGLSQLHQRP